MQPWPNLAENLACGLCPSIHKSKTLKVTNQVADESEYRLYPRVRKYNSTFCPAPVPLIRQLITEALEH